ncbi:MBL fold metallo-hydrolase [Streptomyces sp. CAU 1734]|uniref:MBL fold metallo-hydrolase n=1 Tax=Streptomyces sp. CAU 1734 TaxID=3140360 RepID=UPI00326092FE
MTTDATDATDATDPTGTTEATGPSAPAAAAAHTAGGAGSAADRRAFLRRTGAAGVLTAGALAGGTALTGPAAAAPLPAAGPAPAAVPAHSPARPATALPDYAPVPASSHGPAVNSQGYYVGKIKGNLYWVTDSNYQAMFLSTTEGVVLIDAPPAIGHNLPRAIAEVTRANGRPGKVTHLVHTHSHYDHIGASSIFGKNVTRIAHTETKRLLRALKDPDRPLPDVTFDDRYTLKVGGERLELAHHGANHTPDNIFVHAPAYRTLMVVDVVFPGWVPFRGVSFSQDLPGSIAAHDTALRYSWDTLVSGHVGRLGTRADVRLQQRYIADLEASGRYVLETFDPTPFLQRYAGTGNNWAIFKHYLEAVAKEAADPVITKYLGKLGGVDVFTPDNAYAVVTSLRLDHGVLGPFGIRP